MIVKDVTFGADASDKLKKGVDIIAKAVNSSMGPRGRTTLLEDENVVGGFKISKDGSSIANSINLYDPIENLAVQNVKAAANRTSTLAGDGSTATVCLIKGILDAAKEHIEDKTNVTEVIRHINSIAEQVDRNLVKMSKEVSGERLFNVATISANNDPKLGKLIADTYSEVKSVTVENSQSDETYNKIIQGIKIDRGYTSRFMVNEERKQECILEDVYILITDYEITNLGPLEGVLAPLVQGNKPLLIIGNLSDKVLYTLNKNIVAKQIRACNILPPSFGYKRDDLLTDLAIALGGQFISEKTGDNLESVTPEALGRASKIIVSSDSTIIVPQNTENRLLTEHLAKLKSSRKETTNKNDLDFIEERIANISGGVGVIYVGANSEIERKEIYDRVEDSVMAVRSAIQEGVLPGGGIALLNCSDHIVTLTETDNVDLRAATIIMTHALASPFSQILANAGKDSILIEHGMVNQPEGYGYDAKNEQYGMMEEMGILDATKVVRNALKNAVSVATTILSTDTVISNTRA